jgi:hypothetical protein
LITDIKGDLSAVNSGDYTYVFAEYNWSVFYLATIVCDFPQLLCLSCRGPDEWAKQIPYTSGQ